MAKAPINQLTTKQLIIKTGVKQYILAAEAKVTETELTYIKKQTRLGAAYLEKEKRIRKACLKRLGRAA